MKLLTGNDLATGAVIWWTGGGWSLAIADAVDVGDTGGSTLIIEDANRRVNAPYIIEAEATDDGPRPAHIKDRVRALGPTVRLDLSLQPLNPAALERIT